MHLVLQPTEPNWQQKKHMLGGVMLLSQHSSLHRRYSVAEWQQRILPAFELNQFCYYEDSCGRPVAFCNWAFVSLSIRDTLLAAERELIREDWQSGDHIFIPEMIAPYGHARAVVSDLRRRIFLPWKGQRVCTVRGHVHAELGHCVRRVQWFSI
ncbi:RTX toxin-activating lysine-acyltransferase RtxC [Aeromonas hydrophila]|uniref:RTX toxin-activating lysine-acyltransferase RtxC n=1 Tax=Aeromonas hydrophila TaxID=644 RepID=UPI000332B363|nr:RTX toxin-activating lysine-acyltransferase RtxC [Aeromonas hydrophila]AGM43257.1 cytolysin-activating lysine-acyltransferase rtxC [Aeromonas hydrophila ML09-119]EGX6959500.1 RTX toxin-activating lysine-acyltransferase RtxC [Aeromonas hydrophila]MCA4699577.1 RTX toxin-activating lysine-acyltransferase RtxC [Aeromonas hydrophila]MCO4222440.1 RTX toxin-activating lysine-acyltransferase RtxC [Aeromonas hydrophila]OLO00705.1 RTX toxin-activating lysine-acyltransferase RtxC [Aeromonas hydrophila